MGPPKKRVGAVKYSELMRRIDCFEYRWSVENQSYYLFNPYTGETLMQSGNEPINRALSMWAIPDKRVSVQAAFVQLFSEGYKSRTWGFRKFKPYNGDKERAAFHITTVARGCIARRALQKYYSERYYTVFDSTSGYLYFTDSCNPDEPEGKSWYKPLLATPWDIKQYIQLDREDYIPINNKYTDRGFVLGPYFKKSGLAKRDLERSKCEAFKVDNERRDVAIKELYDIDIEKPDIFQSVVIWLEGTAVIDVFVDEYLLIRAAILDNNWLAVMDIMDEYKDNSIIRIFGLQSFAKSEILWYSPDVFEDVVITVFRYCLDIITTPITDKTYCLATRYFAMQAFRNIISTKVGRHLFFNTDEVPVQGDERPKAVEKFLEKRMKTFNQYFHRIPTISEVMIVRGTKDAVKFKLPTSRGTEVVEASLLCLCHLSEEFEFREQMASLIAEDVCNALTVCESEPTVIIAGLKLMYNWCYRCEGGQEAVLSVGSKKILKMAKYLHSGDLECARQIRRLDLAIKENGWRGYVEKLIDREYHKGEELEEEFLYDLPGGWGEASSSSSTDEGTVQGTVDTSSKASSSRPDAKASQSAAQVKGGGSESPAAGAKSGGGGG